MEETRKDLIDAETAKEAVPFCPNMYYDQYLTFYAARLGRVVSLPDRLIRYRIHSSNQTLVMGSVNSREDYIRVQIDSLIRRLRWLQEKHGQEPELKMNWRTVSDGRRQGGGFSPATVTPSSQ